MVSIKIYGNSNSSLVNHMLIEFSPSYHLAIRTEILRVRLGFRDKVLHIPVDNQGVVP